MLTLVEEQEEGQLVQGLTAMSHNPCPSREWIHRWCMNSEETITSTEITHLHDVHQVLKAREIFYLLRMPQDRTHEDQTQKSTETTVLSRLMPVADFKVVDELSNNKMKTIRALLLKLVWTIKIQLRLEVLSKKSDHSDLNSLNRVKFCSSRQILSAIYKSS